MVNSTTNVNNTGIYSVNNPTVSLPTNFRGNANTLEKTPANDTVEITDKPKKKKSLLKRALIGIGTAFAGLLAFGTLAMKHDHNKLMKLYKSKLVYSNFPEKMDFVEAKTVQEGIDFAKNVLGVIKVDESFTLDAINFANKGIVDVCNANKGRIIVPSELKYVDYGEKTTASMGQAIDSNFGVLKINKKFFEDEFLTKELTNNYKNINDYKTMKFVDEKYDFKLYVNYSKRFGELFNKFKTNPSSMTIAEKRELLLRDYHSGREWKNITKNNPEIFLRQTAEHFSNKGIKYNIEDIEKLTLDEQRAKLCEILKQYREKTGSSFLISETYRPNHTIYHELGHLQDFGENQQKLDMKQFQIFTREYWDFNKKIDLKRNADEIANRWNRKEDIKDFDKLLAENPEQLKKKYPELVEFLTDEKIQKIAGSVSSYAKTGIGEFIAEVYAKMIAGEKIQPEVLALYKKYNGPIPANFKN